MFLKDSRKNLLVLVAFIFLFFICSTKIAFTQDASTKDSVKSVVKGVLSNQKNPKLQMIGLGSWISGGNYKDPLNPNFKVPSDHDLRIVVPKGTPDDEAIALWKSARENLKQSVLQKFGPEKGQKILETINVYPPDQLVKGVSSSSEAEKLLLNKYGTNPNLADGPIEGLFKESSQGWKQAYEAKKGRAFYYDPKTGNVVTTSPDLIHLEEGYGKITMGGMAETADDWIEHLDEALKKKDPLAVKKYLERLDDSLKKSKDLARISHDDYLSRLIDKIDDGADELSDELVAEINRGVKQAKFESKALNVLSKGGFDKYGRIIAGILDRNNAKWARFRNALGTIADNVPMDTLLQGVFVAFDSYQSYEAYKDGNYEDAYRQAFAAALSNVGLSVAIPAALTNAIIEDAKENGYILMVSRQDCEGLLVGECNMIGRTSVLEQEDKVFTTEFEKIIADKDPKTEAQFDAVFGPIIHYNARKCADRGFGGVVTDFADSKVGDACWARCSKVLKDKWNKSRVGKIAELSAMGEQFKQEFLDGEVNISYEPDPITLPEDPKATQQVDVKFAADYSGNQTYMAELFKSMQEIIAKKAPNYTLTGVVTYKWFAEGQVLSTVDTFIHTPSDPIFDIKKAVLTRKYTTAGKHHITLKYAIRFRYSSKNPDADTSDSIYTQLDAFCKNLLMIKQGELDINVEKAQVKKKDPDKTDPNQSDPEKKDPNQKEPDNQDPNDPITDDIVSDGIQIPGITEPQTNKPTGQGTQPTGQDDTGNLTNGKTLIDHITDLAQKTTTNLGTQVNTTNTANPYDPNDPNNTQSGQNQQTNNQNTPQKDPCGLYAELTALKDKLDTQMQDNEDLVNKVNNDRIDIQNALSNLYDTKVGTSTLRNISTEDAPEPYRSQMIEQSEKLNNIEECARNLRATKGEILDKKWAVSKKIDTFIDRLIGCASSYLGAVNPADEELDQIRTLIDDTNANYNQYVLTNSCSASTSSPKQDPNKKTPSNPACGNKSWQELYNAYESSREDSEKSIFKGCIESQYSQIPPFYDGITNKYRSAYGSLKGGCEGFKTKMEEQIKANQKKIDELNKEADNADKNKENGKAQELRKKAGEYYKKNDEIKQCADIPNSQCTLRVNELKMVVDGRDWWKPQLSEKEESGLPTRKAFMRYDQDKAVNVEEDIKKHQVKFECDSLMEPIKDDEKTKKVSLKANPQTLNCKENLELTTLIDGKAPLGSSTYVFKWSGHPTGMQNNESVSAGVSFDVQTCNNFPMTVTVYEGSKLIGSDTVNITVKNAEITGKISGLTGPIYYGSNKSISYTLVGEPESKVPREYKALWESSPNLKFDPQESTTKSTTVTFDRMSNPTKIWAKVTTGDEDVASLRLSGEIGELENYTPKKGETIEIEQQEVEVVAPEFTYKFDPPAGSGKIGQPVKVQIIANPTVEDSLIDYRWIEPTDRKEISNGVIEIIPKDAKPIKLHVNARVPSYGDTIKDDITSEYTASDVKVTAKVIGAKYDTESKEWQEGKGLQTKAKSFVVDQDILLSAEVEGYKKEDVKFSWSVTDGSCHIVAGQTSDQVTMNRSEPGSCEAKVVVNDKDNRKLGEATTSFTVIPQDDENLAKPIIEKAKKLVAEGKLDEAITELAAGLSKFPKSKTLNAYHQQLTAEKAKVLQNIANLKTLAGQFKFTEAEVELNAAKALHPKYYPVIEAENYLKTQKNNYITQELNKAKQKVLQCTLDEASSTVDNVLKADSANQAAQALSTEIKDKKAKINTESEKIKNLIAQNKIDEAEKALELAKPICSTHQTFADLKKQIDEKRKAKRDEILKVIAAAQTALNNKNYQQALDIVAQIRSDYQKDLIQQDITALNTIESQAKKALEERQKALDELKAGESLYNSGDLEAAIAKFNTGLDTYAYVWSPKDPEPAKYKAMRDEAKAKLAQAKTYTSQSKALSQTTVENVQKAIVLIDKALALYPKSKEASAYKEILVNKLAELRATKQTPTTNTSNRSNGDDNSPKVSVVPQVPQNNLVPMVPQNNSVPMVPMVPQVPQNNLVPMVPQNNSVPMVPMVPQVPQNNGVPMVPQNNGTPNMANTLYPQYGQNQGSYQQQQAELLNQYLGGKYKADPNVQISVDSDQYDQVISGLQAQKKSYDEKRGVNSSASSYAPNGSMPTYDTGFGGQNGGGSTVDRIKNISSQTAGWASQNQQRKNPPQTPCNTPCNTSPTQIPPVGDGVPEANTKNGVDDDGDGVIDEGKFNGNCQIAIHDTGGDKDDQWELFVDGKSIGINTQGKTRFWDYTLSRGNHNVTAKGVNVPDGTGTYTVWFGTCSATGGPPMQGDNLNNGVQFTWPVNVK